MLFAKKKVVAENRGAVATPQVEKIPGGGEKKS
jgi:hypothetical protein